MGELEAAHKEADAARKAKTQATDHCTADTASAVQAKQQEVDAVKREKEDLQLAMSLKEQELIEAKERIRKLQLEHGTTKEALQNANDKGADWKARLEDKMIELEQCQKRRSKAPVPEQTSPRPNPSTSVTLSQKQSGYRGCNKIGADAIDTQGFSIIGSNNVAVMGTDIDSRTCVLRGVVEFISDGSTATAWLDPNYRDPATDVPLCFPVSGTMQFFASVYTELFTEGTSAIEETVIVQIEPHGRLVIMGEQKSNVRVRLDNILYHPLMPFNDPPTTCAPYCFPAGVMGAGNVVTSGCVKYCTPTQFVRQHDTSLKPSDCRCTMLKRLDCFKRNGEANVVCGQFKKLMRMNLPDECGQICAGQLAAF